MSISDQPIHFRVNHIDHLLRPLVLGNSIPCEFVEDVADLAVTEVSADEGVVPDRVSHFHPLQDSEIVLVFGAWLFVYFAVVEPIGNPLACWGQAAFPVAEGAAAFQPHFLSLPQAVEKSVFVSDEDIRPFLLGAEIYLDSLWLRDSISCPDCAIEARVFRHLFFVQFRSLVNRHNDRVFDWVPGWTPDWHSLRDFAQRWRATNHLFSLFLQTNLFWLLPKFGRFNEFHNEGSIHIGLFRRGRRAWVTYNELVITNRFIIGIVINLWGVAMRCLMTILTVLCKQGSAIVAYSHIRSLQLPE